MIKTLNVRPISPFQGGWSTGESSIQSRPGPAALEIKQTRQYSHSQTERKIRLSGRAILMATKEVTSAVVPTFEEESVHQDEDHSAACHVVHLRTLHIGDTTRQHPGLFRGAAGCPRHSLSQYRFFPEV